MLSGDYASNVTGNVSEYGGGPGLTCGPDPVCGFGPFSDFEDNTIGGNLTISGLQTCWLGALRDTVGGNFTANGNTSADPDGNELISSIAGNMSCSSNSPVVQFGDSFGVSNLASVRLRGPGSRGSRGLTEQASPAGLGAR
jgi:hypothetical protein